MCYIISQFPWLLCFLTAQILIYQLQLSECLYHNLQFPEQSMTFRMGRISQQLMLSAQCVRQAVIGPLLFQPRHKHPTRSSPENNINTIM